MKITTTLLALTVLLSTTVKANTLYTGDVYSFSFNELFFTQIAQPNTTYSGVDVSFQYFIDFNNPIQPSIEISLFESNLPNSVPNLPNSVPFAAFTINAIQNGGPFIGTQIFGLNWPSGTWSDLEGLVEVKVLQGSISTMGGVSVTVDTGGSVYSSVQPVPAPTAVWLLGSGLLGLIGVARRKAA